MERNGPKHPVCEVDQLTARLICAFKVKLVEPIGDLRVRTTFGGHRARYCNARDAAACTTWKPSLALYRNFANRFKRLLERSQGREVSSGIKKTARPPQTRFSDEARVIGCRDHVPSCPSWTSHLRTEVPVRAHARDYTKLHVTT